MTIGQRIKRKRIERSLSQVELADKISVSKQTLYKYENDIITSIPSDKIELIAKYLHVSPAYIMGWSDGSDESQTKTNTDSLPDFPGVEPVKRVMIPHYGNIACGKPITMKDNPEMLAEDTDRTDVDFTLMAKGDSMIGVRVMDGDKLFIKEFDGDFVNGEIYVVAVDDESTLKRVYKTEDTVTLVSENPKYPPMVYKESDAVSIRILGRVVFFQGRP